MNSSTYSSISKIRWLDTFGFGIRAEVKNMAQTGADLASMTSQVGIHDRWRQDFCWAGLLTYLANG